MAVTLTEYKHAHVVLGFQETWVFVHQGLAQRGVLAAFSVCLELGPMLAEAMSQLICGGTCDIKYKIIRGSKIEGLKK